MFSDSFGGLNATLGGYNYSKPLEHGRNGFSNSKKKKFLRPHLESSGHRFENCCTLVLKSVVT